MLCDDCPTARLPAETSRLDLTQLQSVLMQYSAIR